MRSVLALFLLYSTVSLSSGYVALHLMHRLPLRALSAQRLAPRGVRSPFAKLWSTAAGRESTVAAEKKLPVTVLSGFLGSGKTTMLRHILQNAQDKKYAVLVNDMSELNIDKEFIASSVMNADQQLIEMSNGCLCCTLRDDLLKDIVKVASERRFDHLLIETTGVAEPWPVAATLTYAEENGVCLQDVARIDTMVTVVDAFNFLRWFNEAAELKDVAPSLTQGEDDPTTVTDLLVNQIEFANLLVVNKKDLVSSEELQKIDGILRSMNAHAEIVHAERGQIDRSKLVGANLYEENAFSRSPRWLQLLSAEAKKASSQQQDEKKKAEYDEHHQHHHGHDHDHDHDHEHDHSDHHDRHHQHNHEQERHGISSFVLRDHRLLHPVRLMDFVSNDMDSFHVVRSKGWFRLASNPAAPLVWSQAGALFNVEPAVGGNAKSVVEADSSSAGRTHAQEIVFIGPGINETQIREKLEACFLTQEEAAAGEDAWKSFENPWSFVTEGPGEN